MSNPANTPGQDIQNAITNYTNFQAIEKQARTDQQDNISAFKAKKGDPFTLMVIWLVFVLNNSPQTPWNAPSGMNTGTGKDKDGPGYLNLAGNSISDLSLQEQFSAAFNEPMTQQIQANFNSKSGDAGLTTIIGADGSTGIGLMLKTMNANPSLFGGKDSSTFTSLNSDLTDLQTQFTNIQSNAQWNVGADGTDHGGHLANFLYDVGDKNDTTGAAGINSTITQDLSSANQEYQTINGAVGTKIQFQTGTLNQWESLFQTLLKDFMTIWNQFTTNGKSG